MKMSVCRTCLSNINLEPLFPDNNLVQLRAEELFSVTGIEIQPNDGLTQYICTNCQLLVNSALKLRQLSSKSNETLKGMMTCTIKIEYDNFTEEKEEVNGSKLGVNKTDMDFLSDSDDFEYSVRLEDYESDHGSNISDEFNDFNFADTQRTTKKKKEICINDMESSDSCEERFWKIMNKEDKMFTKKGHKFKHRQLIRKEVKIDTKLYEEREIKRVVPKKNVSKYLSLAVTPIDLDGPVRCKLCHKELMNLANFRSHAKTHFEPQNACETCGKKFVNASHLRYHEQRVHGRKKRLACARCPYRAVDLQQLQNHDRATHTGERPYICDVCGQSFRMRRNIAQHMRRHFGVKCVQCDRCPAMFRSRSELSNHQNKAHYLVYTYFCYLCTGKYKGPCSVRKHLLKVHGVPRAEQRSIKCVKTTRNAEKAE